VVVGIETNSTLDQPDSRGTQLLRALDWAGNSAPAAVRDRVDATRQGVAGHSMGGGGTISAMNQRPSVRAGVPLAPWHSTKSWPGVRNPVMILGGQNDSIAPVSSHAIPLYNGVASGEKAYAELAGAGHNFANSSNPIVSKALVSWFKRFLDDDTRFSPFACDFSGSSISQFRSTCPV
jgi:dienelactone hydrolase